jgi:acyl carrier protein
VSTPATADLAALERELAQLFVDALNLETPAEQIDPEASLFGDGLGLDSIDILEVALEISQRYGFQLRSDDLPQPAQPGGACRPTPHQVSPRPGALHR